ncbi:MAG TPA: DUF5655 domain-containing protein [Anaerolineales bacterium]|nr:DUF5655 domain-containing protein [Anaerolineales bacterium]
MRTRRSLWTCPDCGRTFVSVNRNHSCGRYSLEDHFAGKEPIVRVSYERLLETMEEFGPVGVFPVKTRIIFQAEVQFATAMPRKRWLDGYLWLRRQAAHPRIRKVEMGVFRDYGHVFRLTHPEDLDDELADLLQEAYMLGCDIPT